MLGLFAVLIRGSRAIRLRRHRLRQAGTRTLMRPWIGGRRGRELRVGVRVRVGRDWMPGREGLPR